MIQGIKAVDKDQTGPFSTVAYEVYPGPFSVSIFYLFFIYYLFYFLFLFLLYFICFNLNLCKIENKN